jgi:hypothetical protein
MKLPVFLYIEIGTEHSNSISSHLGTCDSIYKQEVSPAGYSFPFSPLLNTAAVVVTSLDFLLCGFFVPRRVERLYMDTVVPAGRFLWYSLK